MKQYSQLYHHFTNIFTNSLPIVGVSFNEAIIPTLSLVYEWQSLLRWPQLVPDRWMLPLNIAPQCKMFLYFSRISNREFANKCRIFDKYGMEIIFFFVRFFTSQNWNDQIWIKIEPNKASSLTNF